MADTKVEWRGLDQIQSGLKQYEAKIYQLIRDVAAYIAPKLEAYAKQHAPWKDRTSNARQALHGFVNEIATDIVQAHISHGMDYGKWLEVRWSGKYAILWQTISAHFEEVTKILKDALG